MKKLTLLFSLVTLLVLVGCTKPLELPPENADFHFKQYQRVNIPATRPPWTTTGIFLKEGDQVLVLASGKASYCIPMKGQRDCDPEWRNQPPVGKNSLTMTIGGSKQRRVFRGLSSVRNAAGDDGYVDSFETVYGGELKMAFCDWSDCSHPDYYDNNQGGFLVDVLVYDPGQKEGFKRFLRAMIKKNPEDSMFIAQAQELLKY